MSKVLVDREEIEAVRNTLANGGGAVGVLRWAESILAQPAEAGRPGDWEWLKLMAEVAEQDRPWDPRLGMTDVEMAYAQSASPSKVLELIAALSAVTAERDRLLQERGDPAGSFEKCMQAMRDRDEHSMTIDQLRAEVEALRKDAERYRWLAKRDRWASLLVDFDRNSTYRRHRVVFFTGDDWPQVEGQTIDEAVDAAMAAKEA